MTIRDGSPVAEAIQTPLIVRYWHERVRHAGWFDPEREMAVVLCLNVKYRIVAFALVSLGTLNEAIVHPRDVFRVAIALNSYGILLMHNHPSGDPSPSGSDRALTARLTNAADLLQIKLVDHIIIGEEGRHFSFKDEDILFHPLGNSPLLSSSPAEKKIRGYLPNRKVVNQRICKAEGPSVGRKHMKMTEVIGKSREEIEKLLKRKERHELLDVIAYLANLEPMFSPERIAAAREIAPSTVLALIKKGAIRAHLVSHNRYRAPLSAIREWDAQTALQLERSAR